MGSLSTTGSHNYATCSFAYESSNVNFVYVWKLVSRFCGLPRARLRVSSELVSAQSNNRALMLSPFVLIAKDASFIATSAYDGRQKRTRGIFTQRLCKVHGGKYNLNSQFRISMFKRKHKIKRKICWRSWWFKYSF